ncbi:MAG TPA: hypothetical protein VJ550_00810 [Geomonas sp.]|nr:hypothetical protein [Geomonas sp.]
MSGDKEALEEVVAAAQRIIIRTGVGWFTNSGPAGNIVTVESRVAFSTVVNELYREGCQMVTPQEYAEQYGLETDLVYRRISEEGTLFLLVYPDSEPPSEAVPLEERNYLDGIGRQPT